MTTAMKYIDAQSLTANVTGGSIPVANVKELTMTIQVPSISGAPNGLISLQGSIDNGVTFNDITGAFSELPGTTAAALAVMNSRVCVWSGLNFDYVRLKYTRSSGGTANTISAQYRVR
jgi:hypothetical protein